MELVGRRGLQTSLGQADSRLRIRGAPEGAEKRELVRPFAEHVDCLEPEHFSLLVGTIHVTRRAGSVSSAPPVHHHGVVPRRETVCQVKRVSGPDSRRHQSIKAHGYTDPRARHALTTRSTAMRYAASRSDMSM
jgi:hypothetical protein